MIKNEPTARNDYGYSSDKNSGEAVNSHESLDIYQRDFLPYINGVTVWLHYVSERTNCLTQNNLTMTTATKTLWKIDPTHSEVQFK